MNAAIYNLSMLAGVILLGVGVGLHDLGAGLCVGGGALIGVTVFGVRLARGGR